MENIVDTNNSNLRLCELRVGIYSTLRVSLPQVSSDATSVQLLLTNGTICTAYSAAKNTDGVWICDVDSSQFSSLGKQKYEVAYVLSNKQFYDGAGWVVVVPATTSGIVPQPIPPPHRWAIISITQGTNVYYADSTGNITLPPSGGSGDVKHSDFANVSALSNLYRMNDMKEKINEILSILKGTTCLAFALIGFGVFGGVEVQKVAVSNLWSDAEVVTNVNYTADIDTNAVKNIVASPSVTNEGAVAVANAGLLLKQDKIYDYTSTNAVRDIVNSATGTFANVYRDKLDKIVYEVSTHPITNFGSWKAYSDMASWGFVRCEYAFFEPVHSVVWVGYFNGGPGEVVLHEEGKREDQSSPNATKLFFKFNSEAEYGYLERGTVIIPAGTIIETQDRLATTNSVANKQDKLPYATNAIPANIIENPPWITAGIAYMDFVPWVTDKNGDKTAVTIGTRSPGRDVGVGSLSVGDLAFASGSYSVGIGAGYASGSYSLAQGSNVSASGQNSSAFGDGTGASGTSAFAIGSRAKANSNYSFAWSGSPNSDYNSHGVGTFNINPVGGASGFYVGEQNLTQINNGVLASAAATASQMTNAIASRVDYIEGYLGGNRVRLSVTNYYGNTSGELPRLKIEEFITETNYVGDVAHITNFWRAVWDEQNKYENFKTNVTREVAAMTNGLERWSYNFMMTNLLRKADRAWGKYTSAGEAAPPDMVWHSATKTVFAGGTEFAHAVCGTGVIAVLSSVGAPIYTEGSRGRFFFQTEDGGSYFGLNIQERYELPCDTDGIVITQVGGNNLVSLTYNVTTATKPILYYKANLSGSTGWEQLTDSSGQPVPGASIVASWDDNPPAGSEICEMNCGAGASGFFTAALEFAGSSKFETNMAMDIQGGILATNQTNNQIQPVEPYIVNGQVLWRVKQ